MAGDDSLLVDLGLDHLGHVRGGDRLVHWHGVRAVNGHGVGSVDGGGHTDGHGLWDADQLDSLHGHGAEVTTVAETVATEAGWGGVSDGQGSGQQTTVQTQAWAVGKTQAETVAVAVAEGSGQWGGSVQTVSGGHRDKASDLARRESERVRVDEGNVSSEVATDTTSTNLR